MDIIEIWKPEYVVGVEEIDQQHRYLFELWILLENVKKQPENRLSLQQALFSLLDYVEVHFNTEEKYLQHHPKLEAHRRLHKAFIDKTREFSARFETGTLDIGSVADYLYNWLCEHIVKTDIPYFLELKKTS